VTQVLFLAVLFKVSLMFKYKKVGLFEVKRCHDTAIFDALLWVDTEESALALNTEQERISLSLP
jgi:hypothetical protein